MYSRVLGYFLSCKNNVLCYSLLKRRQLISVFISLGRLREKFSRRKIFQFLDRCFLFHAISSLSAQSCSSCGGGLVAKSCPTLATPWTGNLPGSSVHGILQARILEQVAIYFSRGSFDLGIEASLLLQADSLPTELQGKQILRWT